jgi:hypothetical protein
VTSKGSRAAHRRTGDVAATSPGYARMDLAQGGNETLGGGRRQRELAGCHSRPGGEAQGPHTTLLVSDPLR